jgi:3-oxoacyl-[acyl-carrier-protein] synthase-3
MKAAIRAIEYYLPQQILDNNALAHQFPEWTAEKIIDKTGIEKRYISDQSELSSDLGINAAQKLFQSGVCQPKDIDYLLFCTQSPDYFLPTTACIMQDKLGLPTSAGALDYNLGCSGFVYGLGMAKGLIETGQASNVLLITGETYSKFINSNDKGNKTIFGDAAAATLISAVDNSDQFDFLGPFAWGTDGKGAKNLIVAKGGMRHPIVDGSSDKPELYMHGPEIFSFTLRVVPAIVADVLSRASLTLADIDRFVFHQANQYMLNHLQKKLDIPPKKFSLNIRNCGNTVSSTIPIAIKDSLDKGEIYNQQRVMVVGFGVGYSWAAGILRWNS